MDNNAFSKFVSSRVSTSADNVREPVTHGFDRKRHKRNDNDDSDADGAPPSRRQQRAKKKQAKQESQDSIAKYRDRAKERREGLRPDEEDLSSEDEDVLMSASDVKFDAAINEYEFRNPKDRTFIDGTDGDSANLLAHRGCFDTREHAIQWVNGNRPELPLPQSDVANGIVEFLRNKTTEVTSQHLSLHRSYYTFGTQWNPWWERPVLNTFYNSHIEKQPWTRFPTDVADTLKESCRRISRKEDDLKRDDAENQCRDDAENQCHDGTNAVATEDSDDDDDIFAGAGEYDATAAIKDEDIGSSRPALKGPIFNSSIGSIEGNWNGPETDCTGKNAMSTEALVGFSDTLEVSGVDMDFEVHEQDPKKKKKKRRRKKGDDDSD